MVGRSEKRRENGDGNKQMNEMNGKGTKREKTH